MKKIQFLLVVCVVACLSSDVYQPQPHNNSIFRWGSQVTLLDFEFTPNFQALTFKQSPYYIIKNRTAIPFYDDQVRKAEQSYNYNQFLHNMSRPVVEKYLAKVAPQEKLSDDEEFWKFLRFDNGHFVTHCDKKNQKQGHLQISIEVMIPPKTINNFQNGELILFEMDGPRTVTPHATKWTHVICPLGIFHQVKQVIGTRYSIVRNIFIKKVEGKIYNRFRCRWPSYLSKQLRQQLYRLGGKNLQAQLNNTEVQNKTISQTEQL